MDVSRYEALFESESREQLAALNHLLLELEQRPGAAESVDAIFRAVHTLKGMSAAMGYAPVAELAHAFETLLECVRRGERAVTRALLDVCFEAADALESTTGLCVGRRSSEANIAPIVQKLAAFAQGAGPTDLMTSDAAAAAGAEQAMAMVRGTSAPHARRAMRHARIDLRRLDTLIDLVGELTVARDRLVALDAASVDRTLSDAVAEVSRLVDELQDEIMRCRLVPVRHVFDRYPRLVRDAARALGKQIDFTVEGEDTELDRALLDEIGEPIVHLLRNAVAHGVESPEARAAAGKPPAARLVLHAAREGSSVTIRVSDDGRGIDRDRVLAKARQLALIEADSSELTDADLVRLISRPGFSTAEEVTELSGRGVGIDAVHSCVRALGGTLEIASIAGRGTSVTVRLPLTLAVVRALLAQVAGETYVVPMVHVAATAELRVSAIRQVHGRDVLVLRDEVLPLIRFRDVVRLPAAPEGAAAKVLLLESGERRAALAVDDLIGQQDVVVKQVDAVRGGVAVFSGAAILADGAPALVVDVGSLL